MKTLDDLVTEGVSGRTVLVRPDLDVPLVDEFSGAITATVAGRFGELLGTEVSLAKHGDEAQAAAADLAGPTGAFVPGGCGVELPGIAVLEDS